MTGGIYNTLLLQPLFNGLVLLYEHVSFGDLGLAIIFLTIIVRIALFPLFHKTAKHQRIAQELHPEIKKIQEKHRNNKEEQAKELMELYKKNKVNPLTPIMLLALQMPILFALYKIFITGLSSDTLSLLYPFVSPPTEISQTSLGFLELNQVSLPVAVLAAAAQFAQGKLAIARSKSQQNMPNQAMSAMKIMIFIGPAIALAVLTRFPAAVGLYWLTSTAFSIVQQAIVNKSVNKRNG